MPTNRFQPPAPGSNDAQAAFEQLSQVLDQQSIVAQYKPVLDALVSVAAGEFRRLSPRAAGQNVTIPTADGSNFGQTIRLLVESSLGTCRVRPVTGTINGATSFTLAAGYVTLIELTSNGNGKWATQKAAGFPTAGNALSYTGETLNYVGSTSTINVTPTSGALGDVNISTLQAGGVLTFQNVTADATIAGFTAKPDGFWFICHVRDATTAFVIKLLEDAGVTVANGIRTPDIRDIRLYKNDAVMLIYSNSRWRAVAYMPRLFLTGVATVTWAAQQDNFARTSAGQNRIRATLTGNQTLTGVVPDSSTNGIPSGEILVVENVDSVDTLTIAHQVTSTAANQFICPDAVNLKVGPLSASWWAYDDTTGRWRFIGISPAGRLLARTVLASGTAQTFTHHGQCRFFIVRGVGGGAAGGGAAGVAAGSLGSGGGSGTYGEKRYTLGATTSTYTVGAAGTGVSGAAGNNGTASTWLHNAVTLTLPAGSGGTVLAVGTTFALQSGGLGGGGATNADWFTAGERGDYGIRLALVAGATGAPAAGGKGGSTPWGIGGSPGVTSATTANGAAGGGPGAGGGGQANGTSTTASAGPSGFAGQFIVEEYS